MPTANDQYPWRDPDVLERLYREQGLSAYEIAEELDCCDSTIYQWLHRHNLKDPEPEAKQTPPKLKDKDFLARLYNKQGLSQREIAEKLGCGTTTVSRWMKRHGIETRRIDQIGNLDALNEINAQRRASAMPLRTDKQGYERWSSGLSVHRLAAIAWFGIDNVLGKHIHHKNGIPWDNRRENLEPLSPSEHAREHRKLMTQAENPGGVTLNLSTDEARRLFRVLPKSDCGEISNVLDRLKNSVSTSNRAAKVKETDDAV